MSSNYWKKQIILNNYKKAWIKLEALLDDKPGIYILTRHDENGFRFAYIGQSKAVLTRLAQHSDGHEQHIDRSIKAHKLYSPTNMSGWKVKVVYTEDLDNAEREYIKQYADWGFQLLNKTSGGQNEGKSGISENKPAKGYYDGIKQGYKNCKKEVRGFFKYLKFLPNQFKNNSLPTELALRKEREFAEFLKGDGENGEDNNAN